MSRNVSRFSLVAAMLSASIVVSPALGQTVSFAPQRELAVGNGPFWVTAGDFNGDGKKDLATSNRGSNDVSVLLGNGDGTFQAARSFPAGGGASYVGVGDFNGDGKQDLATADYNAGTVSVLRGVGDGTFLPPQSFSVGGINPNSLAVGEFNGDGAQDLAVAVFGGNTTTARSTAVLLGTGTGVFQPAVSYDADRGPLWVDLADFNGDGEQDLVVANFGADTVSVLLGNGNGTFQAPLALPGGACSAPPCGAAAAVPGDFDGDGAQDLVVVDYRSYEVAVLMGNGNGTFGAPVPYATGPSPATIAVTDLTGDGVPDLAVPNWDFNAGNTLSVLVGNGDGTFQAAQTVSVLGGRGVLGIAAADYNGDGKLDLAISNYGGNSVTVMINASGPPSGVPLTVNKAGTGSGTVTSNPAGINCGSTCTASYASGTMVTLTASAAGGSTFSGWSGGGCSGTGTCSVSMNAATTVTASFTAQAQQFNLTVSKAGTG
ncbi:MAG: FG-GAP repeat domain-containing protein, partial [Solirubrobacterales bacterium]